MTTLIGIRSYSKSGPSIVLVCDNQITDMEGETKAVSKISGFNKIVTGGATKSSTKKSWAIGCSGTYTPMVKSFYQSLRKNGRSAVLRAVKSGRFDEILALNSRIARKYGEEDTVNFLLATRLPYLELYFIDEFGWIKRRMPSKKDNRDYMVLGSGTESVDEYLSRNMDVKSLEHDLISTKDALSFSMGAINTSFDLYTGGTAEIVVAEKNDINNFGHNINSAVRRATRNRLESICKERGY